ncbi:uncharacterized protein LOC135351490 isoform X2 [Halichondria panicea]|uniref:uncharacterized protein LOC135351490 isoform X2 n=1 Tax=Halichondria panicea TaxID=6063 RepID=UPI00312B94F6
MPISSSKVDSKCFNLCLKVEEFLKLENYGKPNLTPPDFWKQLSNSEEAVSSYIVCLIAKLISLDSEHGLKPLAGVYRDLVELPVEYSKYKSWASKPLPTNTKSSALELQFSIIRTIKHLKEWHGFTPTMHLRHMYLRWNLARNSDDTKKADGFEESVIKTFSVAQSKEVSISSPLHKVSFKEGVGLMSEHEEMELTRVLVESVYCNHRRSQFGRLPPDQCRLCVYGNDNLSYVRLRHLVSCKPHLLQQATNQVLGIIKKEISHSHDYGDGEVLLPMLHLFRELITMLGPVDTMEVYRAVIPFYTWPLAHAEFSRRVLDLILLEGKVRGTNFRRKVMAEQNVGVKLHATRIRQQLVHMMVDTSHPLSRGALFNDIFSLQQEPLDQLSLQRLLIRNCFMSVMPHDTDIVELEGKLRRLSSDALRKFCHQLLELTDNATNTIPEEDPVRTLTNQLKQLHTTIKQHAESDEQRDSAVSCSSSDDELQFSEGHLSSFPLPPPHFHTHSLDNTQYPTILVNFREILIKSQQKATPKISRQEYVEEPDRVPSIRKLPSSIEESLDSVEVLTNGDSEHHMTNGDINHVPNGDISAILDDKENDTSTDMSQDSCPPSSPTTLAFSTSDDTISNKTSDDQRSPQASQDHDPPTPKQLLERRQTYHQGMIPSRTNSLSANATGSPGLRRYPSMSGGTPPTRSMSISSNPLNSLRTQLKRKSTSYNLSVKRRSRKESASTVLSPTHRPSLKLVKIVLAGNDIMVSHAAKAYAHLRMDEPNLFSGLDIRFYHVPLSRASTLYGIDMGGASSPPDHPDLPEPMMEQFNTSGNDVHIGRFLAHMDSWYERNLMIAAHHLLRLLPADVPFDPPKSKGLGDRAMSPMATEGDGSQSNKVPMTPAKLLIDTVAQYTQEASHCIHMKLFRVKMSLKNEKSGKIEHREVIMLHRLDVQRLSGKKHSRQVKPFEANVTMTELALDHSLRRSEIMEMTNVWAVRASNIPRAENESFELTIVKAQVEGGRFGGSKVRAQEETLHHSCDLILETRDKPLTVMVDNDLDMLVENVIRLEVAPAYLDQSFRSAATTSLASRRNDHRAEKQLDFPLMTFWPIDL